MVRGVLCFKIALSLKTQLWYTCFETRWAEQHFAAARDWDKKQQRPPTMDTLSQSVVGSDIDTEMTALTSEDITEESLCVGDEVELLQNRYIFNSVIFWVWYTGTYSFLIVWFPNYMSNLIVLILQMECYTIQSHPPTYSLK